jgi:hypothetical protein
MGILAIVASGVFKLCSVLRDQGTLTRAGFPPSIPRQLLEQLNLYKPNHWGFIFVSMEGHSGSDTSSELEFKSYPEYTTGSNCNEDELDESLEPELSDIFEDECKKAP